MFPWSKKKDTKYYLEKSCENFGKAVKTAVEPIVESIGDDDFRKEARRAIREVSKEASQSWSYLKKALADESNSNSRKPGLLDNLFQKSEASNVEVNTIGHYDYERWSSNHDKHRAASRNNSGESHNGVFYSGCVALLISGLMMLKDQTISTTSFTMLIAGMGLIGFAVNNNDAGSEARMAPVSRL